MRIEYVAPLSKALERMKQALFHPFDIGKWFTVGFTVFLATLLQTGAGGGRFFLPPNPAKRLRQPDVWSFPQGALDWLSAHPFWAAAIAAGVFLLLVVVLVLTWLGSRGTFMFLDNVAQDRARVLEPWRRYRAAGNSLFLWRVGFGAVAALLLLPVAASALFLIARCARGGAAPAALLGIAALGLLALAMAVVTGYGSLLTNSFVVPLMYRHGLGVLGAWRRFLPILRSHFPHFILFGLFLLLLCIGIGIAVFLGGCLTCCIGFILLAIPYIGVTVLLPVHWTLRAFSLEYLAQWGADYSVFPPAEAPEAPGAAAPAEGPATPGL